MGVVAALCVGLGVLVAVVKLKSLLTWQYTSDIFTYDQLLRETLRGHFGLEYTYGNQFGEHAYLVLLLLLPLKLILRGDFVCFLAVAAPLAYAAGGIILYRELRTMAAEWKAFVGVVLYLVNFSVLKGLLEPYCGFHPDVAGAFLGVIFIAILAREESRSATSGPPWGLFAAVVLFVSVKEEYALTACAMLGLLSLRPRSRHVRPLLAVALSLTAFDVVLLVTQRTPFNRTDANLVRSWLAHPLSPTLSSEFWLPFLILGGILLALRIIDGELDRYAAALLLMFVLRVPESVLTDDYSSFSWHNLPQSVFLMAAVIFQFVRVSRRGLSTVLVVALAALLGFDCFAEKVPILAALAWVGPGPAFEAGFRVEEADLHEMQALINPDEITAIPLMSAVDWARAGYRFSFFPRGITQSPRGIARYAVLAGSQKNLSGLLPDCFHQRAANASFILYEREGACPGIDAERARFVRIFGPHAIE